MNDAVVQTKGANGMHTASHPSEDASHVPDIGQQHP
jgi:hypothetical protein